MKYNEIKKLILIGALTSKPYAFKARSWELKNIDTIDLFESVCSNIKVDVRGSEIMRILPVLNEKLNEEWISDKSRFAYDGLQRKRFINPMIKQNGLFVQSSWNKTFSYLESILKNQKFNNIIINTGNFNDLEQLTVLDNLKSKFNNIIINNDIKSNHDLQEFYTIKNNFFESEGPQVYILVGVNLRLENPILNIKLKKLSQKNSILIGYIGANHNYNMDLIHLGTSIKTLNDILKGTHQFSTLIQNFLKKNSKNIKIKNLFKNNINLLFGHEASQMKNFNKILNNISAVTPLPFKFNINVLENYSGKINAKELGLFDNKSTINTTSNLVYLLNSESTKNIKDTDFVIFQGTHNEKIRHKFDIILPSLTWLEKSALYINCFGIIQRTNLVTNPPVNARTDWKILQMFSLLLESNFKNKIKIKNNFNNIDDVHYKLNSLTPQVLESISNYELNKSQNLNYKRSKFSKITGQYANTIFKPLIFDYYKTNSVDKNSKVMTECSNSITTKKNNFNKN